MGNVILNCKGFGEYCSGKTNIEINNNIQRNGVEINLDKTKVEQGIKNNTLIPDCKIEFSPEETNTKQKTQKTYSRQHNSIMLSSNQININLQQNFNIDSKEAEDSNNNFAPFFNDNNKNEKMPILLVLLFQWRKLYIIIIITKYVLISTTLKC